MFLPFILLSLKSIFICRLMSQYYLQHYSIKYVLLNILHLNRVCTVHVCGMNYELNMKVIALMKYTKLSSKEANLGYIQLNSAEAGATAGACTHCCHIFFTLMTT